MDPSSPIGLIAHRYALGEAIDRGCSTVFRAYDQRLRRDVAIKQIRLDRDLNDVIEFGGSTGVDVRAWALHEARTAARLASPHVVALFDVVEDADSLWLVMEMVAAPSLYRLVDESGPIDDRSAARIALDVLDVLDLAHATGIVHRDVKPANVLVEVDGSAKLTDFGSASSKDGDFAGAPGIVMGSPSYMAPEQAKGDGAGPSSDHWALGALLYFAVEGVAPFDGGSVIATAASVVHRLPRPQRRPGPLSPLIAALLDKAPERRPDPEAMREALTDVLHGDGSPLDPRTSVALPARSDLLECTQAIDMAALVDPDGLLDAPPGWSEGSEEQFAAGGPLDRSTDLLGS